MQSITLFFIINSLQILFNGFVYLFNETCTFSIFNTFVLTILHIIQTLNVNFKLYKYNVTFENYEINQAAKISNVSSQSFTVYIMFTSKMN